MTDSTRTPSSLWPRALLALLSGAVFVVITTPRDLPQLQWVAWIPLLFALRDNTPRRDFFLGWLAGTALNIAGFYWIVHTIVVFSNLPLPLALVALLLFASWGGVPFGVLGLCIPRLQRAFPRAAFALVPALWVTIENTIPVIFPFHQGDLQFRNLPVAQLSSITGIVGVSFLVVLVNVSLFEAVQALQKRRPLPAVALSSTLLLVVTCYAWGSARVKWLDTEIAAGPRVKVGLIQGNYGVQERHRTSSANIFARYVRLTEEAVARGATLVVWGEGASPYNPSREWTEVQDLVQRLHIDLITGGGGASKVDGVLQFYNAAYGIEHENVAETQRYAKRILLAFGEYLPGGDIFPSLKGKIQGIGDFTPGTQPGLMVFSQPGGELRALLLICYEAILDSFVRQEVRSRPNVLVNITHDAWFGDTACPHQFLMLVSARAVEHGMGIIRVANTGISAVVDPTGRIRGQTPLFEQSATVEELTFTAFPTLYPTTGPLFSLMCGLVTLLALVRTRQLSRSALESDSSQS